PSDGACKAPALCAGVTCAASDLCHLAGTCDPASGFCTSQTAKQCPPGQACDPSDGACKVPSLCAGVICPPPVDACHLGGSCVPSTGVCSGQPPKPCPSGEVCDPSDGQCVAAAVLVPRPQRARELGLVPPVPINGLAADAAGGVYVAGAIIGTQSFDG